MKKSALGWIGLTLLSGCSSAPIPWGSFTTPAEGDPTPIGSYAAGCLKGAAELPDVGDAGYLIMRPERRRWFAHPQLVKAIQTIALSLKPIGLLGVGDLSQPRGGPMKTGHRSHQVGLDVDLWYFLPRGVNRANRASHSARKVALDPFVPKLNPKTFTRYSEAALKAAAELPEVERIFVTPAVKAVMCKKWKDSPLLQKLRPWWGHDDHFHVRLFCPSGTQCEAQEPLPAGTGCDATLDWWFSDEARELSKQKSTEVWNPDLVKVPSACRDLARDLIK